MAATICPITLDQFVRNAKPLSVTVDGKTVVLMPKQFSTGSFGYGANEKVAIDIDGTPVTFQLCWNTTAVGSKPQG